MIKVLIGNIHCILIMILMSGCVSTGGAQISTSHDRFSQKNDVNYIADLDYQTKLALIASQPVDQTGCSHEFYFGFLSASSDWKFLDHNDLHLILDGDSFGPFPATHKGDVGRKRVSEIVSINNPSTFIPVFLDATEIEMRLGRFEYKLTAEQVAKLHEYADSVCT